MRKLAGKYYLYRHIRLDKNEPFYIGYGSKYIGTKITSTYRRAFDKCDRTNLWKRIFNKTDINIEILFENSDLKLIYQKEREFIKLYGRIDLGTGPLVNFTDGGEGSPNHKKSPSAILKTVKSRSKGKVFAYSSNGNFISEFMSAASADTAFKLSPSAVGLYLRKKRKGLRGLRFFIEYKGNKIEPLPSNAQNQIPLGCYDKNWNLIKIFNNKTGATKFANIGLGDLKRSINNHSPIKINRFNRHGYVLRSDGETYQNIKTAAFINEYCRVGLGRHINRCQPKMVKGYTFEYIKEKQPLEVYFKYIPWEEYITITNQ